MGGCRGVYFEHGGAGVARLTKAPRAKNRQLSGLLYALSLIFLGMGLVNLGWAVWPTPVDAKAFTIPAGPLPGAPPGTAYTSLGDIVLEVSWPRWIRAGEEGQISAAFSAVDEGEAANPAQGPQVILVEPSLMMLQVDPPGRIQVTLGGGQDLTLTWAVEGETAGAYPGKVVVAFGFFDEDMGELVAIPVAVVDVAIRVVALLGLTRRLALWFGVVGLALWGAVFLLGRMAQG